MLFFRILLLILFPVVLWTQQPDPAVLLQADSLMQLSDQLRLSGQLDLALQVNGQAGDLLSGQLGKESSRYADQRIDRCLILVAQNELDLAEQSCQEGVDIRGRVLGKTHPAYARGLFELAHVQLERGLFDQAEALFREALALQQDSLSADPGDQPATLNGLGMLYLRTGRTGEALEAFQAAADSYRGMGKRDMSLAAILNNIGAIHYYSGNYRKALSEWFEVLDIRVEQVGKDHEDYAATLNNIALCYQAMSKYELAEPMFLEAKAVWERHDQIESPWYAGCLLNLGQVYAELGIVDQAEEQMLRSCRIWSSIRGTDHPDVAMALRSLAGLYKQQGRYIEADSLLDNVLVTLRGTLGEDHPEVAFTLADQATSRSMQRDFARAEGLYQQAVGILERTIGTRSLPYVVTLQALAGVYQNLGQADRADELYATCEAIYRDQLGVDQMNYGSLLFDRSLLSELKGRHRVTEHYLQEKAALDRTSLLGSLSFLSEHELEEYAGTFEGTGQVMLNMLYRRNAKGLDTDSLSGLAADFLLFLKGFVMTTANRVNALANRTTNARALQARLEQVRTDWSNAYVDPLSAPGSLQDMEREAVSLEKELVRTMAQYDTLVIDYNWQQVQQHLAADEVAVEFAHFPVLFPASTDSVLYAAIVIRPGDQAPRFIPLFEASMLDILSREGQVRKSAYVDALYSGEERGMVREGQARPNLYQLIWAPVVSVLPEQVRRIYFSPSGILHRLNLGAIAIDEETVLADRYQLIQMTSTRQVSEEGTTMSGRPDAGSLIFAGIDYDPDPSEWPPLFPEAEDLIVSRSVSGLPADSMAREVNWAPLKWTTKEGQQIAEQLRGADRNVDLYEGSVATEELLKSAGGRQQPSPRVVHLATHGFFFPDPGVVETVQAGGAGFQACTHSMIRSGLILAGGNYAWKHGRAVSPGKEDGILTAYEISQMDLSNTELVVLSACETGLGDIQGNEGVYGLQRAFKIAGAKYLIMSLWQVPDRETMQFMTTFYHNWLEEKLGIPEAFRKTQLEMRDRFFNPFSWAGFVLVE